MQSIGEEDSEHSLCQYDIKPTNSRLGLNDLYDIDLDSILGRGTFSVVYGGIALCPQPQDQQEQQKRRSQRVAIKCIPKSKLKSLIDIRSLHDEADILKRLSHPKIQTLYAFFDEQHHYYLVTERIEGGELFDRIVQKEYYDESEARDLVHGLVQALDYLHRSEHVAHRDVKPENLMLVDRRSDSNVKLVDFGCARSCVDDSWSGRGDMLTYCGTPSYVAPEVIAHERYGTQVDMWSVGVTLFVLLGGYPPFAEDDQRLMYRKIRGGVFEFHEAYWDCVGDDAKALVKGLLTVDPRKRMSAAQVLDNDWICEDVRTLSGRDLSGNNLTMLKKYGAVQKLRAAVLSLIAVHKFRSLLVCPDLCVV